MWFLYVLICYLFLSAYYIYVFHGKANTAKLGTVSFSKDSLYLICIALFLIFFSSLRYPKPFTDTVQYFGIFDGVNSGTFEIKFALKPEPGYLVLNRLIGYVSLNHQLFLFFINFIVIGLLFRFILKYSKCVWLSIFLFVFLGYFDTTMNLIRFSLSLCITLIAYDSLREKKILNFTFFVLLAMSFHVSSLIFFIVLPLIFIKERFVYKFLLLMSASVIIVFLSSRDIIAALFSNLEFYSSYENNPDFGVQEEAKLAPVLEFSIMLAFMIVIIASGKYKCTKDNWYMFLILSFSVFFLVVSFIFTPIGRVSKFFTIYSIILVPNAMLCIDNKMLRNSLVSSIVFLCLLRYVVIAFLRPEWAGIFPYKFYFE